MYGEAKLIRAKISSRLKVSKFLLSIIISPLVGLIRPKIIPIDVVLPQPFGPNKPSVLSLSISKFIPFTAKLSLNFFF